MSKLRRGDKVIVMTGKDRLKVGTIEKIFPETNRAIIGGINLVKKHLKRTKDNPQGGIIDRPASLHLSNLKLLDPQSNKPTRVGFKQMPGSKIRLAKRSKQTIVIESQK